MQLPKHGMYLLRWRALLRGQKIDPPLSRLLVAYFAGLGAGVMTPGRVGETIRVAYLGNTRILPVLGSLVVERLMDLGFILAVSLSGALVFQKYFDASAPWLWVVLGGGFAVTVMTTAFIVRSLPYMARWLGSRWERIRHSLREIQWSPRLVVWALGATALGWILQFSQGIILAVDLGVNIPAGELVFILAFTSAVSVIPVTVAGLGTREAAMAFLFVQAGESAGRAVGFSLCLSFLGLFASLLGSMILMVSSRRNFAPPADSIADRNP
jgi:hypothetical protein